MIIENGAEEAANDIALPEDSGTPELVEVTYDGKTYELPAELKDALLRQQDYTRKTQEVAEGRRALEDARGRHDRHTTAMRAHFTDAARVMALTEQMRGFDQVDWAALKAQDPQRADALWQQRQKLRDMRNRAIRAWSEKDREHASHSQRATARRVEEVHAHLPRLIADWSPELDGKLAVYGTEQGLSREEMAQAALQNPHFMKLLHKAHQFDDTARKAKDQQTFDAAQAARPVAKPSGF
jgi:hypothetical protein